MEFLKDYQLLIGTIIIALVIYQFTGSDLDTCIDGFEDRYEDYTAIEVCMELMY